MFTSERIGNLHHIGSRFAGSFTFGFTVGEASHSPDTDTGEGSNAPTDQDIATGNPRNLSSILRGFPQGGSLISYLLGVMVNRVFTQ